LTPIGSYNIYYKKGINEFILNHSNEGKFDYSFNQKLFRDRKLLSSLYFKNELSGDDRKFSARFKFHFDSDKLFVLALNRNGKASEATVKDYFKNISLAGFYGFTPAKDFHCIAGAKADFNPETRILLSSAVTLSANYKEVTETLNFGRVESKNILQNFFNDMFSLKNLFKDRYLFI
jgi:hypothetical protein